MSDTSAVASDRQQLGEQPDEPGDREDAALVARARDGDVDAFAAVYDRHARGVLAVLARIVGQPSEAQDLLHDVFIEAWQGVRTYDPSRASVRVWLTMRARARALDRLRRVERDRAARARLAEDVQAPAPMAERDLALREALATLEPPVREAVELTYFEGLTAGEVGARTSTPEGTVRSRLARGIACLQLVLRTGPEPAS
ncbi:MAG: sigma-70 family RNA polymerase sigma factor [Polyangiales bacterium]